MCTCVGDVHIGVMDRGGQIEVELTQARGLTPKPGSKNIPGKIITSESRRKFISDISYNLVLGFEFIIIWTLAHNLKHNASPERAKSRQYGTVLNKSRF